MNGPIILHDVREIGGQRVEAQTFAGIKKRTQVRKDAADKILQAIRKAIAASAS
jgi:hypothetical protein